MVGFVDDFGGDEVYLTSSDPIVNELNRLQNLLKDKERVLGVASSEIKALRATEALKDKAVVELSNELGKLDEKLRVTENLLEQKTLEIKKVVNEKKEALAAQFAAEAALRRVHVTQRDDDYIPVEAVVAPLESEIKMYKNEIAILQEDKKALERLTKSKEAALLEAEKILNSAMERALIVEEVQNQNFELKKQIEIFQEENKILDKANRQKVLEVEKLGQTICELEEAILAGGGVANAVRDYRRQISELNEEKRMLERELARVKVSANRIATVVANEWKDDNDKVMPVKQWLDERKFLQGEIQRLKDKLAISERTAKAEAQLKDKMKLRLKTLEEGLKHVSSFLVNTNASSTCQQTEKKSNHVLGFLSSNAGPTKRSTSQPRPSLTVNRGTVLHQPNVGLEAPDATGRLKGANSLKMNNASSENMLKRHLWAPRNKFADDGKENTERKENSGVNASDFICDQADLKQMKTSSCIDVDTGNKRSSVAGSEDLVSGFLYDRLQREVIHLRKLCQEKDGSLNAKDEEIKVLLRKVDTLTKAMEIESKKMKREVAAKEKEITLARSEDNKQRARNMISKRALKHQEASANSRS